ncbi:hypothetical protein FQZ97_1133170 [compost metagenome]
MGEYMIAHARAIQRTIRGDELLSESLSDGRDGRAAFERAGAGNGVGVDHGGPPFLQQAGHRALAATDTSGEPQAQDGARGHGEIKGR